MRIVTLLPSATDIVLALGAEASLVGVSPSCTDVSAALPRLTSTRVDNRAPSAEIDAQVKAASEPLYDLDVEQLERLAPDVVVSQSLCDVCAVASGDVEQAVRGIASRPTLVNLSPFRLDDVPEGFRDVGAAIGRRGAAAALTEQWHRHFDRLRDRFRARAVRVAFLDWLDPPCAAGHWIPDLLELLGCRSVLAAPGEPSREVTWADVRAAQPELILAACCGLDADRAGADPVPGDLCVQRLDGDQLFSRPSPTLTTAADRLVMVLDSATRAAS